MKPVNERLESVLLSLSLRKTLLSLVASRIATSLEAIDLFFKNTLYWYQTLNNNPKKLSQLQGMCREAVTWLVANKLLLDEEGMLAITRLGRATAISGLLPDTAVEFAKMLTACAAALASSSTMTTAMELSMLLARQRSSPLIARRVFYLLLPASHTMPSTFGKQEKFR